ncbi:hypothetical protein U1Q18_030604 [Sarracenia purpurea var. burkii]
MIARQLAHHGCCRSSLHRARHSDYSLLTLARLEHDSVKSLQARLNLVINGIVDPDLKAVDTVFVDEELGGPVISGTSQGSVSSVKIPPQTRARHRQPRHRLASSRSAVEFLGAEVGVLHSELSIHPQGEGRVRWLDDKAVECGSAD